MQNNSPKRSYFFASIQANIEQIVTAQSEADLTRLCSQIAEDLEVSYFSHGMMWSDDFHNPKFKIISNYHKKWLEEYDNHAYYQIDPRAQQCMKSLTPIFWNTEKNYLNQLEIDAKKMMENAHEHGVYSGITAPIFSFKDVKGAFSFGLTLNSPLSEQRNHFELISPFVNYLGVFVHQTMMKILKIDSNNNDILLTDREVDCLSWAADGKKTAEIATLLYLSESTIKYHFKNASRKLNAKNTTQALSIAILKGYIQPTFKIN